MTAGAHPVQSEKMLPLGRAFPDQSEYGLGSFTRMQEDKSMEAERNTVAFLVSQINITISA